jgi:hypothetical protein
MGVASSGATLEIQLVADVARLKRDMDAMKSTVASATSGVAASFSKVGGSTGLVATQMAATAQSSARAAVGLKSVGMSAMNARIVQMEMFHVTKALTEQLAMGVSPARAFASEIGRIGTAVQFSGGIKGLISMFGQWLGIVKTTTTAELAEAAASAAANAQAIQKTAERAAATLQARQTQVALAEAQLAAAEGADAEAAAQARLVKALRAVEVQSGKAAIANDALATANAEAAAASEASAARSVTSLGRLGYAGIAVGLVLGTALGAVKLFQAEVDKSGVLDRYIAKLGLTDEQVKKLKDTHVTFGDVAKGVWNTIADHTGADRGIEGFKTFAVAQFRQFLHDGVTIFAELYGDVVGTYRGIIVIWKNFPAAIGDAFYSGVNNAIGAINKLIQASVGGVNSFIGSANSVLGKFGVHLPTLTAPQIAAVANQYAGAAAKVTSALKSEQAKATAEARASAMAIIRETERNIIGAAESRIGAQVDAARKAAGSRAGGGGHRAAANDVGAEAKAYQDAAAAIQQYRDGIQKETDAVGQDEFAQKRMAAAVAAAAARKAAALAPTEALRQALLDQADAAIRDEQTWERVTKSQATADFVKNTIDPLERQVALLGLSAEAQARANLEAEKGAIVAKYGADAWERYFAAQSKIIDAQNKAKSPLEEWGRDIPKTASEVTSALQQIEFRGLDNLSSAIADVVTGTKSLKAAFSEVAKSIIADIIQMTVKMLLFRAVSAIFGGNPASAGGGDIFSAFEESSGGGGFGIPGLAGGGFGVIGGMGGTDSNLLSLNGRPVAWVSNGEGIAVGPTAGKGGGSDSQPVVVNQYNNFAGGAVTRDDLVRMHAVTVAGAKKAVDEARRRAA